MSNHDFNYFIASSAYHLKICASGLALIFRPCLCVMAKRLRDVCALPESECSGALDAAASSALDW
jgi:hypothetical protein